MILGEILLSMPKLSNTHLSYAPDSPLLNETRKPPLKMVKNQNYGLARLKKSKEMSKNYR